MTNDEMDDLVDEWHDNPIYTSLTKFLEDRTGYSREQIIHWIETAELPEED
jgi:hypothetical protein